MRRSHRQSSVAAPWFVMMVSLLLLMGLASACGPKEEATESTTAESSATTQAETPAETPVETPAATPTPTPTPTPAGSEITITGLMPPRWDPMEDKVGPGDTVIWKIGGGRHSLKLDAEPCKIAEAKMTFDPPLVNCVSQIKNTPGEEIVRAKVNQALDADLPFRCGVHAAMTGTLKPR
jgi:plastocyanin